MGLLVPVFFAFAVPPTTNIDSINKFAWSDSAGWINFGCTNCGVMVTDSGVAGYAWSANYGWINLSPDHGGITNSNGTLSGTAWGTNTGWIYFSGTHNSVNCAVAINSEGKFSGKAYGDVVGTVNFSCTGTGCPVTTEWRPVNSAFCGDGLCNGTESHLTCPEDCISVGGGTIACTTDANCGTDNYNGDLFCQDGSVYQNYTAYTCNSGGTVNSSCSNSTIAKLKILCASGQVCSNASCVVCATAANCGTSNYTGPLFCQDGKIYQNYLTFTCDKPGTSDSSCLSSTEAHLRTACTSDQTCDNGSCVNKYIACAADTDCGKNDYNGSLFCQDGNVYQNYLSYACAKPGTSDSSCSNSTTAQLKTACTSAQTCDSGTCANKNLKHNECNGSQCISVDGAGINQCVDNDDCVIPKHNECNAQKQCVTVNGEGADQCQVNDNCIGGGGTGGGGGSIANHNECNAQKQCIAVGGSGSDQCQTDSNCLPNNGEKIGGGAVGNVIMDTAKTVDTVTTAIINQLPGPAKAVAEETKKIIQSPAGAAVTKTVAVTGFVVTAVATTSPILSFNFFEIFLIPLRLFGLLMTALGIKKKSLPWGVVYDSVTKRPLDPAYVVLKDAQGKVISTAITDLDGRYGFLVQPGVYQMQANKTNYIFPSQKLAGKSGDELHNNLYFGESITPDKTGVVIIKNIPLDPIKFDWNEFAKKDKKLMKFYSKWDIFMRKIYDFSFITGFIVAIIAFIFAPYPYNTIIMGSYLILLVLRILGLKPKSFGYIIDKDTNIPLSFAIIRVLLPDSNTVITSKSADKYGKYYCLIPPGKYYTRIEKKNMDGSYSLAYTSPVIDVSHKGIIKNIFKI